MKFDPDATAVIPEHTFRAFLDELQPPLGFTVYEEAEKEAFLKDSTGKLYFNKLTGEREYFFHDVLLALTKRRIAIDKNIEHDKLTIRHSKIHKKRTDLMYRRGRVSLNDQFNPDFQNPEDRDYGADESPTKVESVQETVEEYM